MLLIKYTIYLIFLKILHFILFAIFCKNCYCSKSCIKFPCLLFLKYELYESTWLREFSPNILYMPYISLIIQKKQKHLFFIFLLHTYFVRNRFKFSLYCTSGFQKFILNISKSIFGEFFTYKDIFTIIYLKAYFLIHTKDNHFLSLI